MAPVIKQLEQDQRFHSIVVATAQHREMLDQVLDAFKISPDYDLNIMKKGQKLEEMTAKILLRMSPILCIEKPAVVLVHGDTTTAYAAAVAAFYQKIPIGHVEAGLRTWNKLSPFPEEMNRQLIDVMADYYFAPTLHSKWNLLKENLPPEKIYVTGNTAIDAMKYTITDKYTHPQLKNQSRLRLLITMHRRENLGKPMKQVFNALVRISKEFPEIDLIFPMHKNPQVRQIAHDCLDGLKNVYLIEALDVIDFHNFAARSYLILTDSGGIQEEAPSLGVPVLVLRDTTERPEGVASGALKLIGMDENKVYKEVKQLLCDEKAYKRMKVIENPYGDGHASQKILEIISENFTKDNLSKDK